MKILQIAFTVILIIMIYDIFLGKAWSTMIFVKVFKINSPSFEEKQYENYKYRLCKPKNYKNESDLHRKYPLVIYLHGAGGRGNDNSKQSYGLRRLGNGFGGQAKSFKNKYPCFVYVPQCPSNSTWNNKTTLTMVTKTIEKLISEYPIDRDRLYLIGYSMGGSGTYALVDQYYNFNKQLFAAIIRLAGQSSFDYHVHKIISKSAVWLHVGLHDASVRIEKAREAYGILKDIYKNAFETTEKTKIKGHPGTTLTLTLNNIEKVKKTEYEKDGHSISGFPFDDPELLEWLFNQTVSKSREK